MDPNLIDTHADVVDRHWWFMGRARIVRALADRLLPEPGGRVVDLGCGVGANSVALAADYDVVGIDASERSIGHARRLHPDVTFVEGDVLDAGPHIETADLVLLMDVLEHVVEDRALLEHVIGAARPGTHLLLTVPAAPELWSAHDVMSGHVRRYVLEDFAGLWAGLPVEQLMVSHCNTRLFPIAKAVRRLQRLRRRDDDVGSSDLAETARPLNAVLARVFSGESGRIVRAIDGGRPYRRGLSLIAVLRKVEA